MKSDNLILSLISCLVIVCSLSSCGHTESDKTSSNSSTLPINVIKVGGIYISGSSDKGYHVVKILAEDSLDVYLRFYSDRFPQKPDDVKTDNLNVLIGYTPMSKVQFSKNQHELLKVEPVKDSELEGYKNYKEAIK